MPAEIGIRDKLFDLSEAKELLPLIQVVTERHFHKLDPIQTRMAKMLSNDPRRQAYEQEFERQVSQWRSKVAQLGARVAGLWAVEFDVVDGSLCWRYPELTINSFRKHGEAFSERVKLRDYIDESDPEWV